MGGKSGITIVGAGNLASALAYALRGAGYSLDHIVARTREASLRRAQKLARQTGARASTIASGKLTSQIVWFCVSDSAIARAADDLAAAMDWMDWKGKIGLHSSGALSSDALDALRRRGAAVASVHPLMTFVPRSLLQSLSQKTKRSFAGIPFAIEGDARAATFARRVVRNLGGQAYPIQKKDKAAYHAWATFASPLFVALLATTERLAPLAGISREAARKRMLPILRQTLANYAALGAAGAFSGPIIRGDVDTVKRHLQVLRSKPAMRKVYIALVQAALEYLPTKNQAQLRKALHS